MVAEHDAGLGARSLVEATCRLDGERAARQLAVELVDRQVFAELREARGLTYTPAVSTRWASTNSELLTLAAEVATDRAAETVQSLLAALEAAAHAQPTELAAAKTSLARRFAVEHASTAASRSELLAGIEQLQSWPRELADVEVDAVNGVLQSCVGHEIATAHGPEEELREGISGLLPLTRPLP